MIAIETHIETHIYHVNKSNVALKILPGIDVEGGNTDWVNEVVLVIGTGGRGVLTILLDGEVFDMEMEFFIVANRSTIWLKSKMIYCIIHNIHTTYR